MWPTINDFVIAMITWSVFVSIITTSLEINECEHIVNWWLHFILESSNHWRYFTYASQFFERKKNCVRQSLETWNRMISTLTHSSLITTWNLEAHVPLSLDSLSNRSLLIIHNNRFNLLSRMHWWIRQQQKMTFIPDWTWNEIKQHR